MSRMSRTQILKCFVTVFTLLGVSTPSHTKMTVLAEDGLKVAGLNPASMGSRRQPIFLQISQIWEGSHIDPVNLQAIHDFREQFAGIPITHFLNPAYYTKEDSKPHLITSQIVSTIHPQDGYGLHLHGWRSLVDKAGIIFRDTPTFWGNKINANDCREDCGHEVPLTSYTETELVQLLQHSQNILQKQGFPRTEHFLAGGWVSGPQVMRAIQRTGFRYDYSAVPPQLIKSRLKYYPIGSWLQDLWGFQKPSTPPRMVATQNQLLTQVGTSIASMDYLTEHEVFKLFQTYAQQQRDVPEKALYFHLSFYHETAAQHLPRLAKSLQMIFSYSHQEQVLLQPTTLFSHQDHAVEVSADQVAEEQNFAH